MPVVLFADSSNEFVRSMGGALLEEGFEVVTAADGRAALEYLRDDTPHLILADVALALVSGVELCGRTKKVRRLKDVPVVLTTTSLSERLLMDARLVRANGVLTKDVQRGEFCAAVHDVLGGRPVLKTGFRSAVKTTRY